MIVVNHMETKAEIYQSFADQQSMKRALDLYGERLMRFANCYVNDIYQAEDIMMETFVELLVRKPVFENEFQFRAYLYRTAKNKSINYLNRHKKLVPLDEQVLVDIADLEKTLYRTALEQKLRQAMQKINARYRQVIVLSYFDGLKNPEIAEVLNLNEKAVGNLKHRAKQKLNRVLSKENFIFTDKGEL